MEDLNELRELGEKRKAHSLPSQGFPLDPDLQTSVLDAV